MNTPNPQIVFPPDTRIQVTNTLAFPFITVGSLQMRFPNGEDYTGTGTLLSPIWVLTCAHNVFDANDGGDAVSVTFIPGQNAGVFPAGTFEAADWFYPRQFQAAPPTSPRHLPNGIEDARPYRFDIALIQLAAAVPVLPQFCSFTAPSDADLGGIMNIAGYPGDKPAGTMWNGQGFLTSFDDTALYYQISTEEGSSGSAVRTVLPVTPAGPCVVGVHIGARRDKTANTAVRITNELYQWILLTMNNISR